MGMNTLIVKVLLFCFLAQNIDYSFEEEPNFTFVCDGGLLSLTCSTNSSTLRWNVTFPPFHSMLETRSVTIFDRFDQIQQIGSGSIMLNISRSLADDDNLPLISVMSSENVTDVLNGTIIRCGEFITQVHVIGPLAIPNTPNSNLSEHFRMDYIEVVLKWALSDQPISYRVKSIPQAETVVMKSINTMTVMLTIPYNSPHNVTVVATLCNKESQSRATEAYGINYIKCGHPLGQRDDGSLMAIDYSDPALEGTNVTLSCSSDVHDFVLTGANAITCLSNGQWDPDPMMVECKANCSVPIVNENVSLIYTSTLEGSFLVAFCDNRGTTSDNDVLTSTCHKDGNWVPDPIDYSCSSLFTTSGGQFIQLSQAVVIAVAVSLTIFVITVFVIGFLFGCVSHKYMLWFKSSQRTNEDQTMATYSNSEVELAVTGMGGEQQLQNPEMIENIAYGSLQKQSTTRLQAN